MRNIETTRTFIQQSGDYMRRIAEGGALYVMHVSDAHYDEMSQHLALLVTHYEEMMEILTPRQHDPDIEKYLAGEEWKAKAIAFADALIDMRRFVGDGKLDMGNKIPSEKSRRHMEALDAIIASTDRYLERKTPLFQNKRERN